MKSKHIRKNLFLLLLLFLSGCSRTQKLQADTAPAAVEQTFSGYTIETESAIAEPYTAYVTMKLTAPESVDLSPVLDLQTEQRLSFRQLTVTTEGDALPADLAYEIRDDDDGKKNTVHVVLQITPLAATTREPPFWSERTCHISFHEIVLWGYDRAYEQELRTGKYAGQTGYFLTPEESDRVHPQTVLASGEWSLSVKLPQAQTNEMELLSSPITTKTHIIRTGTNAYEAIDIIEEVSLTSVRLTPRTVTVVFEIPQPAATFQGMLLEFADVEPFLVMTDGSKVGLFQPESARSSAQLTIETPVNLQEVSGLQLPDGTLIEIK